ncbi:hypothetical protein D3C72_825870 [compost metagenome]
MIPEHYNLILLKQLGDNILQCEQEQLAVAFFHERLVRRHFRPPNDAELPRYVTRQLKELKLVVNFFIGQLIFDPFETEPFPQQRNILLNLIGGRLEVFILLMNTIQLHGQMLQNLKQMSSIHRLKNIIFYT